MRMPYLARRFRARFWPRAAPLYPSDTVRPLSVPPPYPLRPHFAPPGNQQPLFNVGLYCSGTAVTACFLRVQCRRSSPRTQPRPAGPRTPAAGSFRAFGGGQLPLLLSLGSMALLFWWTRGWRVGIIWPTGDIMEIHLSKPGGQREGPFTLEQIKRDLAANRYRDTDYWAWHPGLTEWVPLYRLPGISTDTASGPALAKAPPPGGVSVAGRADAASPGTAPAVTSAAPVPARPQPLPREAAVPPASAAPLERTLASPVPSTPQPATPSPSPLSEPEEASGDARQGVSSGMPAVALEQIFLFTTGDGPSAWQSPTVTRMLKEITGEGLDGLPVGVPRDVIAQCAVGELLRPDGSISEAVWRAMAAHRPAIVQQARDRLYHVCVRTFHIEADAIVAVVLFYKKQQL